MSQAIWRLLTTFISQIFKLMFNKNCEKLNQTKLRSNPKRIHFTVIGYDSYSSINNVKFEKVE